MGDAYSSDPPNGLTYTFSYDSCGFLNKITYPSGGYTRYVYTPVYTGQWVGAVIKPFAQNELTAKYVCSAPSITLGATATGSGNTCSVAEEETTYAPVTSSAGVNNVANTITDAVGNATVYQFSTAQTGAHYFPPLEISRQYIDANGHVLKTVQNAYNDHTSYVTVPLLPLSQTTTLDNGFVSQIQWTYDLEDGDQRDSRLLEKREYDYGKGSPGALLRKTDYDWWQVDYPASFAGPGSTSGNPLCHILDNQTSETVYDGAGRTISQVTYQYDNGTVPGISSLGDLTKISRWRNTDGALLTTSNVWGAGGITSTTDPNGKTTSYSYTDNYTDGVSRNTNAFVTKITHPLTPSGQLIEQRSYYWGSGLVAATCGENFTGSCKPGLSSANDYTSFSYDLLGRRVSASTGDGGAATTCFSEITLGNCHSSSYPLQVTSTKAIAASVTQSATVILDGLARATRTQVNSDPSCSSPIKTDTVYDAVGRVSSVSNPYCSTSDPTYGLSTTTYDGLSRVTKATHPDKTYASSQFTGRAVLSVDEGNGTGPVQHVFQVDGLGRLAYVCELTAATQKGTSGAPSACGLDVAGTGFLTSYSYDVLGNLSSVSQGTVSRSFLYDSLSRLTSGTNPESGTTTYAYDLNGNLTSKTSANKSGATPITTTYTYDSLNRLLGKSYSDLITPAACFRYDQGGTRTLGRLTAQWTQAGTCAATGTVLTETSYAAYDLMGRGTSDNRWIGSSPAYTVSYVYDLAGDTISATNGLSGTSAMSFTSAYDSAGHLSTVTGPYSPGSSGAPMTLFAAGSYNPAGAIQRAAIGPGISQQRAYNNRLLPTDEIDSVMTTPGTAIVQLSGADQLSAYSTGSLTFSGVEQSTVSGGQTIYDGGLFLVSINGGSPYQLTYGQYSTPQTLATNLAASMTCSSGPVQGVAEGASVILTSCQSGTNTGYRLSAINDGSAFPQPSFSVAQSGPTMTPTINPSTSAPIGTIVFGGAEESRLQNGSTVYDAGNYLFMFWAGAPANGSPVLVKSVSYAQTSTPSSLASTLAASFSPCSVSGTPITASASGAIVTLTSCQTGTNYYVTEQLNGSSFSPPSLTAYANGPGTLVGGPGVYDAGTVVLTINGSQIASATYGSGSNTSTIVSALVAANGNSSAVTLSANGTNLVMTSKTLSNDSATYAISFSSSEPYYFNQASFSSSSTSGTLVGGGNAPLYNWAVNSYAPNGDVLSMTDSVMGTWQYGYDDLNRLASASAGAGTMSGLNLSWDYDRYGNRWDQNATGSGNATVVQPHLTFSGNNNRIDSWSYDADGNVLNDGTHTYTYDAENRVIAINGQPTYIYDASGARVAKLGSGGAVTSVYILGLGGEQLTELNGSGQWEHSNVWADGRLVATYTPATSSYHYNLTDWLGTKRMQTVSSGNQEQICTSYPFGDGLSCVGGTDTSEHHFTGKERDSESGLDYFGARHYSSSMGRFMSPDWDSDPFPVPYANLENPQTLNLYSYVQNNPLSSRDLDGHASFQDCNGGTQQCWQGDYNGERDCSGSAGCLFWNQGANGGAGEWQGNDPTPPPGDPAGDAFTGLTRMMLSHSWGDFNYGLRTMGGGYAKGLINGPSVAGVAMAAVIPILPNRAKLPNLSGKDGAKNIPSWAAGSGPQGSENGKQYASRMMDAKYGAGNWATSSQEFSQLKKYGDRSFAPAERAPSEPTEPTPPEGPIE